MPILCQICKKSFEKMISGKHLKNQHGITSKEYKNTYNCESITEEYQKTRQALVSGTSNPMYGKKHSEKSKKSMGDKKKGSTPHNKGKKLTDPDKLNNVRAAIQTREENYKTNGNHPRKGAVLSDETKSLISESVKDYARNNQDEILERAQTILKTKKDNGYFKDLIEKTNESRMEKWLELGYNAKIINSPYIELTHIKCEAVYTRHKESTIRSEICDVCYPRKSTSEAEMELRDYVLSIVNNHIIYCDTSILKNNFELDIYIPDLKIAIEYNGVYWHSEEVGKTKWYHRTKYEKCKELGIHLIQIFEDEWLEKKDIVKLKLRHILQKNNVSNIIISDCEVEKIEQSLAREWHETYNIQGRGTGIIHYGLKYNGELIAVMDFAKLNIPDKDSWELARFSIGNLIPDAANKLFSAFITENNPKKIISYGDLRWNTGEFYEKLGFIHIGNTTPAYWYIDGSKRLHRYKFRKSELVKEGFDETKTESEIMTMRGFKRIWDCGHSKWEWNKKTV